MIEFFLMTLKVSQKASCEFVIFHNLTPHTVYYKVYYFLLAS